MKHMKKIFNWIFETLEEPVPEPTPEWRSYEYYDKAYDERHNYLKSLMTGAARMNQQELVNDNEFLRDEKTGV